MVTPNIECRNPNEKKFVVCWFDANEQFIRRGMRPRLRPRTQDLTRDGFAMLKAKPKV